MNNTKLYNFCQVFFKKSSHFVGASPVVARQE